MARLLSLAKRTDTGWWELSVFQLVGRPRPVADQLRRRGRRALGAEYVGEQYGVQVDVSPLAAGMILGTRMGEFGG